MRKIKNGAGFGARDLKFGQQWHFGVFFVILAFLKIFALFSWCEGLENGKIAKSQKCSKKLKNRFFVWRGRKWTWDFFFIWSYLCKYDFYGDLKISNFSKTLFFFSIFENFSILKGEYYGPRLRSFWVAEASDLDTSDILGSFWWFWHFRDFRAFFMVWRTGKGAKWD